MQDLITKQSTIMDRYDPAKKIGLMVDEWGNWFDVEPGTNPGFLFQQNTLRDAITCAINLNMFNNHCDRVKMSNIAQMVNVLQSLILTDGPKMVLTPTYYVFEMYKVHQDAALIPVNVKSPDYEFNGKKVPAVSVSASKDKQGLIHISLVNANPNSDVEVNCDLRGAKAAVINGRVITSKDLSAHNTFDAPNSIQTDEFKDFSLNKNLLNAKLPAKSVVMLEVR
jgi:alpha-L-arabinofuranosidase